MFVSSFVFRLFGCFLFGVTFMVEGAEAVEDLPAGGFADREADTLRGFVGTVIELDVASSVSPPTGGIQQ